jgi:uncharacterized protein
MYFSIIGEDIENSSEKRKQNRVAHLQRLHVLNQQGRLLVAGPNIEEEQLANQHDTYTGSVIIADFDSLADAQQWAQADPYMVAGVFSNIIVKPFMKVLP